MTLDDYQTAAAATAKYPDEHGLVYNALALVGEVGELVKEVAPLLPAGEEKAQLLSVAAAAEPAGETAKAIRKGENKPAAIRDMSAAAKSAIVSEAGDGLWHIAMLARHLDRGGLEFLARDNVAKLADRAAAGTIVGDGHGPSRQAT